MWWRSASFIIDQRHQEDPNDVAASSKPDTLSLSPTQTHTSFMAAADPFNPNPNPNPNPIISAYYQTRAAHTGVVTSDWLAQAQAAVGRHSDDFPPPENDLKSPSGSGKTFSVINEFNNWRKQPDLAEAVAAIRALAAVIRASEATTMMELEIELKKASDSLKVNFQFSLSFSAYTLFGSLELVFKQESFFFFGQFVLEFACGDKILKLFIHEQLQVVKLIIKFERVELSYKFDISSNWVGLVFTLSSLG